MKNIQIYNAEKYNTEEYTLVEDNIWLKFGNRNVSGVLESIDDKELTEKLRDKDGWEIAPEPWSDSFYMLVYDGKRYFKEILIDEDSLDCIYREEDEGVTYVTSLMFEQEPEYGENEPADEYISQYPLEDLLDKFYCYISDEYAEENKSDKEHSFLEFASDDIKDVRSLLSVAGKHVYNKEDGELVSLVIE